MCGSYCDARGCTCCSGAMAVTTYPIPGTVGPANGVSGSYQFTIPFGGMCNHHWHKVIETNYTATSAPNNGQQHRCCHCGTYAWFTVTTFFNTPCGTYAPC